MKFLFLFVLISFPVFSFENCLSENLKSLEECSLDNYNKEDAYLNYLYKEIITTYPELKESIKNTQREWIKARDNVCILSSSDGQEAKIYENSCLYEQTYERNRELKAILSKQRAKATHEKSTQNPSWNEYLKQHCRFMKDKFSDDECIKRNEFLHHYD